MYWWSTSIVWADLMPPQCSSLSAKLAKGRSWEGTFTQEVLDERGTILNAFSGYLKLKRPNFFWWEILEPYQQLYLWQGKKLIIYEPDLEQVIIHNDFELKAEGLAMQLLLSEPEDIEEHFKVIACIEEEGLIRYNLVLDGDFSDYAHQNQVMHVGVIFNKKGLYQIDIADRLGGSIKLNFVLSKTRELTQKDFVWDIPEGIEVINQQQDASKK